MLQSAQEWRKSVNAQAGPLISDYDQTVLLPGLPLFRPIQNSYFTDSELRKDIEWIYSRNDNVANMLSLLRWEREGLAHDLSALLKKMLSQASPTLGPALIKEKKEQISNFKDQFEGLFKRHETLIGSLEKAQAAKDKKLICATVVGAVLVAALFEAPQYFLVAGDFGFGLKQGVEMSADTCVLALTIISYIFSTNIPSTREDQNQREKKCTQLAFAVFFFLSSFAPGLVAKADQLHLPILAVFAGFFLRQISLPSGSPSFGPNIQGGGVPPGRKAAGSMLASCGALAFAYPLIKFWLQSGDNINQFAQTMFKAHCLEAVAAIAGIVLSLGILYRHSDEIRGGVSLVMG